MPTEATVPRSSSFSPSFITDAVAAASAGEMLYSGAAGAAGLRSSFVGSMELMAVPKRKVGGFVSLTLLEKKIPFFFFFFFFLSVWIIDAAAGICV
jgi:hypothetical protein